MSRSEIVARLLAAGCVFAEDEEALLAGDATSDAHLERMVEARVAGTPLEQVLGWADFHGVRVVVEPGVFVPRHRSDALVDEAINLARERAVVVDMCCGTGALGLAVIYAVPDATLHSSDLDPAAVRCARKNVEPRGGSVSEGDLFDALPSTLRGRIDLLIVNAPYVPSEKIRLMPLEARDHENQIALDGGEDGLDVHRRVAAGAPGWLASGGHLIVESSSAQADELASAFASAGLAARIIIGDDEDGAVIVGTCG
jgi:release factor glutamine methyltransferase